jgi:hypothetical protein
MEKGVQKYRTEQKKGYNKRGTTKHKIYAKWYTIGIVGNGYIKLKYKAYYYFKKL